MKRSLILAAFCVVAIVSTASATDRTPADKGNGFSACEERYLSLYEKAAKADLDVGRNLVQWGLNTADGVEPITDARACSEADQLEAALNPPEPAPAPEAAPAPTSAPVAAPTSGAPVDINCESGGDYSINTGNGYYGAYQFDSQTWNAYGDSSYGEANEAPPAVQDKAAASVPYDAWPNC